MTTPESMTVAEPRRDPDQLVRIIEVNPNPSTSSIATVGRRALSRKKNWLLPELVSNSERASAMVPYALNGSAGCSLNRPLSSSVSSYT